MNKLILAILGFSTTVCLASSGRHRSLKVHCGIQIGNQFELTVQTFELRDGEYQLLFKADDLTYEAIYSAAELPGVSALEIWIEGASVPGRKGTGYARWKSGDEFRQLRLDVPVAAGARGRSLICDAKALP